MQWPLLEFVVEGTPVSLQTRRRVTLDAWKHQVKRSAQRIWGNRPLTGCSLYLAISYYYDENTGLDVDNIIKPIQDAMIDVVFFSDAQITDVMCRKRDLRLPFVYHWISDTLLDALTSLDTDFVYIKLEQAPNHLIIDL